MAFEMKLTSFPIEKLCYELKFAVLKEMEAKDTLELVKVNGGFEWMLSSTPSLVFDRHVDTVRLENGKIWLKKFPDSSDGIAVNFNRYFSFLNYISSCNSLWIRADGLTNQHREFLQGLESVNRLYLFLHRSYDLRVVIESFRVSIKEFALLSVKTQVCHGDRVLRKRFEEFIETRLNDCQRLHLDFRNQVLFDFYDNVLEKMRVKFVQMSTGTDVFKLIVSSVLEHGISSQNVEASLRVDGGKAWPVSAEMIDFVTSCWEMQRIEGDEREKLMRIGNDRLSDETSPFDPESLCFRKNIDEGKDCVYICPSNSDYAYFFAFYVPTSIC